MGSGICGDRVMKEVFTWTLKSAKDEQERMWWDRWIYCTSGQFGISQVRSPPGLSDPVTTCSPGTLPLAVLFSPSAYTLDLGRLNKFSANYLMAA